jgi:predicted acyl esterase
VRESRSRADLLVYTTDALDRGLELTAPLSAEISLSSSATDTDLPMKVLDAFPDGRVMNIVEGVTRMRYRDGFATPRLMTPGIVWPERPTVAYARPASRGMVARHAD